MTDASVLVVDLDETALTINTFPRFVSFAIVRLARSGRVSPALALTVALVRRKLFSGSHAAFKEAVTRAADALDARSLEHFAHRMVRDYRNVDVGRFAQGWVGDTMLCTAAPERYAAVIGRSLGYDVVQGSRFCGGTFVDNAGKAKADRVVATLGSGVAVAITDDPGLDGPLLAIAREPMLVVDGQLVPASGERVVGGVEQ